MKRKLSIAVLILAITAGLGWHNHQQLLASRAARAKLLDQAAGRGINVDSANSGNVMLPSKFPRPSREEEIKQLTTSFIAYIDEMRPKGGRGMDTSDPLLREKITQQMDQLIGLDADQWEMLIHDVFNRTDHPANYQGLIGLAFYQLVKDRPDRAIAILLETPGMVESVEWFLPMNVVSGAIDQMFARDWRAALDWFIENRDRLRLDAVASATWSTVIKVGKEDPRLALKLMDDFKMEQPENLIPQILSRTKTEDRNVSLAVLREWRAERSAPAGDETHRNALAALAFVNEGGTYSYTLQGDFAESAAWMAQAGLTAAEFQIIGQNLANCIHLKESGHWIEWLSEHLDEDSAAEPAQGIFSTWLSADYKAAGAWLADHPDCPARDEMARDLVMKLKSRDPELAASFAKDLPEEDPEDASEGGASVGIGIGVGAFMGEEE